MPLITGAVRLGAISMTADVAALGRRSATAVAVGRRRNELQLGALVCLPYQVAQVGGARDVDKSRAVIGLPTDTRLWFSPGSLETAAVAVRVWPSCTKPLITGAVRLGAMSMTADVAALVAVGAAAVAVGRDRDQLELGAFIRLPYQVAQGGGAGDVDKAGAMIGLATDT